MTVLYSQTQTSLHNNAHTKTNDEHADTRALEFGFKKIRLEYMNNL